MYTRFTASATSTGAANTDYTGSGQTAQYQENIGKEGQAALTGWGAVLGTKQVRRGVTVGQPHLVFVYGINKILVRI